MSDPEQDLDWQAFLYVADEMSADDRLLFEQRLATDQAARQALASAVELTQALTAAEQLAPRPAANTPQAGHRWLKLEWMAIGVAASLIAAVIYQTLPRGGVVPPSGEEAAARSTASDMSIVPNLALVWVNTAFQEESSPSQDQGLLALGDDLEEADFDLGSPDEEGDAVSVTTPSWMLAALGSLTDHAIPANGDQTEARP